MKLIAGTTAFLNSIAQNKRDNESASQQCFL